MMEDTFRSLIRDYGLRFVSVDAMEAVLIGKGFALDFTAGLDGIEVVYVDLEAGSAPPTYTMRPLVMERFTPADRACYGNPSTFDERIASSLAVYASGLANWCQDVLSGDRSWLRREVWAVGPASESLREAVGL